MPFTFHHEAPMTYREEIAPFASADALAAMHSITRDDEERDIMIAVFQRLAESWAGDTAAFAGCDLVEAGISVGRMLGAVRGLARRRLVTPNEAAWLKDQLATA